MNGKPESPFIGARLAAACLAFFPAFYAAAARCAEPVPVPGLWVVGDYRGGGPANAQPANEPARASRPIWPGFRIVRMDAADGGGIQPLAEGAGRFLAPAYRVPGTMDLLFPIPEVIARAAGPRGIEAAASRHGAAVSRTLYRAEDQYVLSIPEGADPFEFAKRLAEDPAVDWAEPNWVFKPVLNQVNDPLFPQQWHLRNTGQYGQATGVDVNAPGAWALVPPDPGLIVAVNDSGIDLTHPDLNIYVNPAEAAGWPGADDDGNGFVDDANGWNFFENTNNPGPSGPRDAHGTSTSGLVAAIAGNGEGVAGVAPGIQVLPVRIWDGFNGFLGGTSYERTANALRYAAVHADLMTNSWSFPLMTETLRSALDFAASPNGKRGELGVPVLFAAGNDHGPFFRFMATAPVDSGRRALALTFEQPAGTSADSGVVEIGAVSGYGYDPAIDDIGNFLRVTPGARPFGQGISTGGDVPFVLEISPDGYGGKVYAAGPLAPGQESRLTIELMIPPDSLLYFLEIEFRIRGAAEDGGAGLSLSMDGAPLDGAVFYRDRAIEPPFRGNTPQNPNPLRGLALHPAVISVGACNPLGERSGFSQYGPELRFTAPGQRIVTTDATGFGNGYDPSGGYLMDFGGTSAACPIAAGVYALMLSADRSLSVAEMTDILAETAKKTGPLPHNGEGWNEEYGFGMPDAGRAVEAVLQRTAVRAWELH